MIISPEVLVSSYNAKLLKRILNIAQRIQFLGLFPLRHHTVCSLNVISLVSLIYYKVNFLLPELQLGISQPQIIKITLPVSISILISCAFAHILSRSTAFSDMP